MSFSVSGKRFAVVMVAWLLLGVARHQVSAVSSFSDLDIEYSELKVTLEKVLGENQQLRDALADTEKTLADMRKNLAATTGESEVFKRQSAELRLRMEALGVDAAGGNQAKLEQRLLAAVSDLRVSAVEARGLREALIRLSEASSAYSRSASGAPADARLSLEAELRHAKQVLGLSPSNTPEPESILASITDGMVMSVKEDLALVVINLGSKQGVKVGMPFQVTRGDRLIGAVQVVEVRDKIAGAVIQNLSLEKEHIKVGDHLKVDAHR